MIVHILRSTVDPYLFVFTSDRTGGNIPGWLDKRYGPWDSSGTGTVIEIADSSDNPIAQDVRTKGYYVVSENGY